MEFSRYKCRYARMGIGRWQTSFLNFDYSSRQMLYGCYTRRWVVQTKCRHPSRASASKLFLCIVVISSIRNAVKQTGSIDKLGLKSAVIPTVFRAKMGRLMVKYYPIQKPGSICLHCNVFDTKRHCSTITFPTISRGEYNFLSSPKITLKSVTFTHIESHLRGKCNRIWT